MNTLTSSLTQFITAFQTGTGNLVGAANYVLWSLLAIEIVIIGLTWSFGDYSISEGFWKLIFIFFWLWVVTNYVTLANVILDSLASAGLLAGGTPGQFSLIRDPSAIAVYGLTAADPVLQKINSLSALAVGDYILYGVMFLLLLLAFFLIAIQMFLALLEFYLVAAVGMIFLPFVFNSHTRFMSEKAIGALISIAVKVMVLSFIISVTLPIISLVTLPPQPTLNQILTQLMVVGSIAFLAWNAPGIAAGLMAGSPSLSAGTAVQNAASAAVIGGVGAMATAKVISSATRIGATGAGALSAGAQLGYHTGIGGTAAKMGNAAKGAAHSLTGSLYSGVAPELRNRMRTGGQRGLGIPTTQGKTPTGSSTGSTPSRTSRAIHTASMVSHSLPHEAHPSGGSGNPPLKEK